MGSAGRCGGVAAAYPPCTGGQRAVVPPKVVIIFFIVQKRVLQWEGILSVQLKDGPKL